MKLGSLNERLIKKQRIMKRAVKLLTILGIGFSLQATAQGLNYGTGKDSSTCVENLSVYSFRYKNEAKTKEFSPETYDAWRTAFFTCPNGSKNMYIPHGTNMYSAKFAAATDEATKKAYIDTVMMIYDRRIEFFGEEGKFIGLKGADLFVLDGSRYNEAFDLCKKSVDMKSVNAPLKAIIYLMQTAVIKVGDGSLPKTEALAIYQKLADIMQANIARKPTGQHAKMMPTLEQLFLQLKPSCEDLLALFQPQFDENSEDVETLKKITSYLGKDCSDSELYLNAAVNLDKLEPSSLSKRNIAEMYVGKKDMKTALSYYQQSIELETEEEQKAKSYFRMAQLANTSPSTSVSYANKALAINPNMGEAYLLKARQYYAGWQSCAANAEHEIVEKWKALWAATDLCVKAKSMDPSVTSEANSQIAKFKGNFPDVETLFGYNITVGSPQTISCWFTASTTARARD